MKAMIALMCSLLVDIQIETVVVIIPGIAKMCQKVESVRIGKFNTFKLI